MKPKIWFILTSLLGLILAAGIGIPPWVGAQGPAPQFEAFQSIPTHCALDWESFSIDGEHYVAVANNTNHPTAPGRHDLDSIIYRWDGTTFVQFQAIPTKGAYDWEFFTIDGNHYLAVANSLDPNHNIDSIIYRWDGTNFVEYQTIPTHGIYDWAFLAIDSNYYLAAANSHNNATRNIDSAIFRWDGAAFVEHQLIPTHGACDWEFFTVNDDHYLVVANGHNDSNFNINSVIYRWDGTAFVEYQTILTHQAFDWESFVLGPDHYLVVANAYNGSSSDIDSIVYRWNGTTFVEFQVIPTHGAHDWEFFTAGSDHFLAVANSGYGAASNIDSIVYRWNGTTFVEHQAILTHMAFDLCAFAIDTDFYLAAANHGYPEYNIDSGIYCLVGQSAKDVLAGAETTIEQIEKEGLDTSSLTTMLSEARAALANGDPERAKQLASETKTMADKLLAVYQAIQDAQAAIQEAEDLGCVTKEAQNKLDDAIDALNEANTDVAAQYARESLSLAGKVVCGRVRIVDLKALAARYDGRIIELSGTIRNMETIYAQGYRFTIDDGTDLIGIRHLGSMHKIDTGDTVIVRGTFSKSSGTVEAESVEKSGLGGFLTNKLLWVIVLCALGALGLAGVIVGILFYIREVNKGRMMA